MKSASKRFHAKIAKMSEWLRNNRNMPVKSIVRHINQVFEEYYAYYAVTCDLKFIYKFHFLTKCLLI